LQENWSEQNLISRMVELLLAAFRIDII